MPTVLLPRVRKTIHRVSDFLGPQDGEHSKGEKEQRHEHGCRCIGPTWECPLHIYKLHSFAPECHASRCQHAITLRTNPDRAASFTLPMLEFPELLTLARPWTLF